MSSSNSHKPLHVVQFTDTHFFEADGRLMGVDTAQTFAEVFQLAKKQHGKADFYLLTGDLSQDETAESYKRLGKALAELGAPAYYIPGNHDQMKFMHQSFVESGAPVKAERSFTAENWLVVLLNTQLEQHVHGFLTDDELGRLDAELGAHPDKHALVCLHHHPVPVGSGWMDEIGVENAEAFFSIIDRHKHVRAILWGHIHQQFEGARNGVKLMGSPSTCVQFKVQSNGFAVDEVPPGYRWLKLNPDGTVESGVERVAKVAAGLDLASGGY